MRISDNITPKKFMIIRDNPELLQEILWRYEIKKQRVGVIADKLNVGRDVIYFYLKKHGLNKTRTRKTMSIAAAQNLLDREASKREGECKCGFCMKKPDPSPNA